MGRGGGRGRAGGRCTVADVLCNIILRCLAGSLSGRVLATGGVTKVWMDDVLTDDEEAVVDVKMDDASASIGNGRQMLSASRNSARWGRLDRESVLESVLETKREGRKVSGPPHKHGLITIWSYWESTDCGIEVAVPSVLLLSCLECMANVLQGSKVHVLMLLSFIAPLPLAQDNRQKSGFRTGRRSGAKSS
jgi:hypothetical protein